MTPFNNEHMDDYEDLIAVFNKHHVEYIIVGAYAVGHYGYLRATEDIDLLINPKPENAKKVAAALKDFGGIEVDPAEIKEKTMIEIGVKPNALHLMTNITGVAWEKAWASRAQSVFGDQPAPFLSKECLIANKRATGRGKDGLDLIGLGETPVKTKEIKKSRGCDRST
ncbi:MAG TPA: hypothetical protein DEF68_02765 [Elusimicrobia bacterium]|nr:hypothetical protein [Elusimicrobiota bacterium]HBW22286.1 hypothetical protein [Elusimicrobiota bacterium]